MGWFEWILFNCAIYVVIIIGFCIYGWMTGPRGRVGSDGPRKELGRDPRSRPR